METRKPTIVAIANSKGGVGKTTTAVYLALVATQRGERAIVADTDRQQDSLDWVRRAGLPFEAVKAAAKPKEESDGMKIAMLKNINATRAAEGLEPVDWVFIDVQPYGMEWSTSTYEADFVIIPTRATSGDMKHMWETMEWCEDIGKPCAALLVCTERATRNYADAIEALKTEGKPYFEANIPKNQVIPGTQDQPVAHTYDYRDVFDELKQAMA